MTEEVLTGVSVLSPAAGYRALPLPRPGVNPKPARRARPLLRAAVCLSAGVRRTLRSLARPLSAPLLYGPAVRRRTFGARLWALLYAAYALTVALGESAGALSIDLSRRARLRAACALSVLRHRLGARANVRILFAACGLLLLLTVYYTLGLEVVLDGRSLGFVSSQSEFSEAVKSVSARAADILHYPYYLDPNVTYRYSFVDRHLVFDGAEVEEMLFAQIPEIKRLYVLLVDGVAVTASEDCDGLTRILNDALYRHSEDGTADSVSFVQDVRLDLQWTDRALEQPLSEIRALLLGDIRGEQYDTATEGDSFTGVALRNGMSAQDLQMLNRDVAPETLADGTPLVVQWTLPFLSVEARRQIQYEEEIPYASSQTDDASLYVGDTAVRVKGQPGRALVSAELRYVNGLEVGSDEIGRETLDPPVDEVIAVGTKKRPPKSPTGTFIRPFWGRYTSGFGKRTLFGVRRNHEGLDFAGPTGSPIVASDGGVVIFAGRRSSYGLCVIISHGKGLTTLYAHCSKLLVRAGQSVAQGERIANVGNTGRSTGPHLHFEVRVNDVPRNPWNYLG
ncbi:MAG: peptidoglycan DD-metalloendopeptidase family protein [Oscillospiraceae bacterium]|jgi:murein DD-endopeptidase MepM/ murein hydrolase activator NlpD|nr:peptidoglycan DD-metalloendopeptidase family protein [Oscillospiraceae bacterium]